MKTLLPVYVIAIALLLLGLWRRYADAETRSMFDCIVTCEAAH